MICILENKSFFAYALMLLPYWRPLPIDSYYKGMGVKELAAVMAQAGCVLSTRCFTITCCFDKLNKSKGMLGCGDANARLVELC